VEAAPTVSADASARPTATRPGRAHLAVPPPATAEMGADAISQARQAPQATPRTPPWHIARSGQGPIRGVRAQGPGGRLADKARDGGAETREGGKEQAGGKGRNQLVPRKAGHEEARRDAHGLRQGLARRLGGRGQAGTRDV